jgi:hypothetical protein
MLRPFFAILLALFWFVGLSTPRSVAADSGDAAAVKQVVQTFLKEHLASHDPDASFLKSPLVTPAAKDALRAMKKKAGKDFGLEADPVTGGQDHPDSYKFAVGKVEADKATATAAAKDFPTIQFRLAKEKSGWKIDGVGEINMGKGR